MEVVALPWIRSATLVIGSQRAAGDFVAGAAGGGGELVGSDRFACRERVTAESHKGYLAEGLSERRDRRRHGPSY